MSLRTFLANWLFPTGQAVPAPPERKPLAMGEEFSTHHGVSAQDVANNLLARIDRSAPVAMGTGQDAATGVSLFKSKWKIADGDGVGEALFAWFASQTFIGYQMAAILAQHWLIDKACTVPARDAVRKGYALTIDGTAAQDAPEVKAVWKANKKYKINAQMRDYVRFGRIFGIRIAIFQVESTDPDYYELPFNIDAVKPGTFRGLSQVDPYWCMPELSAAAISNPASPDFYNPTWWVINGKKYHRSHLAIFRTQEPADLLKPMYLYGGVPVPQRIMERVYAAERTANEAPQLVLTKRTMVWKTDLVKFMANQAKSLTHMWNWIKFRDNYGVKLIDEGDEVTQIDTALNGLDETVMTQYQLVAAGAGMPATKLLGTTPKGFNATGEYEESNYNEELESVQENDLTPLLDRYHELVLRSDIEPKFNHAPGTLQAHVDWYPLATQTAKEQAETNKIKADTDEVLVAAGAIDAEDVRERIKKDPDSGYTGLADKPIATGDPLTDATNALNHAVEQARTGEGAAIGADPLDAAIAALEAGEGVPDLDAVAAALSPAADALDLATAAGVILTRADGKTLWLKRRPDADVEPGVWCWPGGTIDQGEKPQDAALRELEEETGIRYGAPLIPVGVVNGFVAFAAVTVAHLDVVLNDEHTEYEWRSLEDPPKPTHPGCGKLLGYG